MVTILMMQAKIATLDFLLKKLFWNKGYDIITYVHNVTNKILSRDSNYIVDAVMWSSISMAEVIITSVLLGFDQENYFFWRVVLVKFQ